MPRCSKAPPVWLPIIAALACAAALPARPALGLPAPEAIQPNPNGLAAYERDESSSSARGRGRVRVILDLLAEARRSLGRWDLHAVFIREVTERFWQRQGWDTDSDRFAKQLVERISQSPPWDISGRIDTAVRLLQQRYDLSADQVAYLRRTAWRETWRLLIRHAPTLAAYGREVIAARLSGRPFSPRHVAKWVRMLRPLVEDARSRFEQVAEQFAETLTPQQREVFAKDFAAYLRRAETVEQLLDKWARGNWRPEEWGLTPEMFSLQWAREKVLAGRALHTEDKEQTARKTIETPLPDRPDTWTAYVLNFIKNYNLDAMQQAEALAILKELKARAAQYFRSHQADFDRLDLLTAKADSDALRRSLEQQRQALLEPVRQMFEELKVRLDQIPTTRQRRLASGATSQPGRQP